MGRERKDVSVKMTSEATATLIVLLRMMEEILTKPKEEAVQLESIQYWVGVLADLNEARRDLERAFEKAGNRFTEMEEVGWKWKRW